MPAASGGAGGKPEAEAATADDGASGDALAAAFAGSKRLASGPSVARICCVHCCCMAAGSAAAAAAAAMSGGSEALLAPCKACWMRCICCIFCTHGGGRMSSDAIAVRMRSTSSAESGGTADAVDGGWGGGWASKSATQP